MRGLSSLTGSVALTREGLRFVLLLGIVGFAAYNNQNNVLYLLLAVGLASLLASLVAAFFSLRGLTIEGSEQPDAYTDLPFRETLVVSNRSWWMSAFGLSVDGRRSAIPFLRWGAFERCRVERLYRRRGVHPVGEVVIATEFPFGFFYSSRRLRATRSLVVFPRIRSIDPTLTGGLRVSASHHSIRRGHSDEFFALRDYVPGDTPRLIHWKASAKVGDLVVREFGEMDDDRLCVAFVPRARAESDSVAFEHLVTAAASLACHLAQAGIAFRFLSENVELAPSSSPQHLRDVLTYLATVGATAELGDDFPRNLVASERAGERILLVSWDEASVLAGPAALLSPAVLLPGLHESA